MSKKGRVLMAPVTAEPPQTAQQLHSPGAEAGFSGERKRKGGAQA